MPGDASSSPSADQDAAVPRGLDATRDAEPAAVPRGFQAPCGSETAASVLSVELKGAGGEAVKIHLSDGSFYVLHAEAWARSSLSTGSPLDHEILSLLLARSERIFARRRALALLARAPQTRLGLAKKLAARGFGPAAVRHAIARMARLGYLDDRAFAEAWVRSRLQSRPEGWKSLSRGLRGRGVPRALADEVAAALYTPEEEAACARRLAGGLTASAAIRRLSLRGFRSRAIALVLREIRGTGRSPREA